MTYQICGQNFKFALVLSWCCFQAQIWIISNITKSKIKIWKGGSSGDKSASWWHPWGRPGSEHGTTDSHPMWSGSILYKEANKQMTKKTNRWQNILLHVLALSMAQLIPIWCDLDQYYTYRQINKETQNKKDNKCKTTIECVRFRELDPVQFGSQVYTKANKQMHSY